MKTTRKTATHVAALPPLRSSCVKRREGLVEVREVPRDSFTEYFLTALARPDLPVQEAAIELYADLVASMISHGIQPLQEMIYGSLTVRDEVLEARRETLCDADLDTECPYSYTDGRPGAATGLAGVQLWGIVPQNDSKITVTTLNRVGGTRTRCWKGPGFRLLFLSAINGTRADGSLPAGLTKQAERMFANAESTLQEHGLSFSNIARTWIRLARILDWYGEFNRVRTEFFRKRGITGNRNGLVFPASTGIQGTSAGEECIMDLLAVEAEPGSGVELRPLHQSNRQQPAFEYGSSFSRGIALRLGESKTILISGTASIGVAGQTLHCGNREAQILETLLSIADLLDAEHTRLEDICTATLFYKDPETLQAYHRVTRLLGVTELPIVPVQADVCRPELLFEMEALAVVPDHYSTVSRAGTQSGQPLDKEVRP